MDDDNFERLINFILFKLPVTNRERDEILPFFFVALLLLLAGFVCANYVFGWGWF